MCRVEEKGSSPTQQRSCCSVSIGKIRVNVNMINTYYCLDLRRHYTLALALFAASRKREAHDNFKRAFEILSSFIDNCPANSPAREEVKVLFICVQHRVYPTYPLTYHVCPGCA